MGLISRIKARRGEIEKSGTGVVWLVAIMLLALIVVAGVLGAGLPR